APSGTAVSEAASPSSFEMPPVSELRGTKAVAVTRSIVAPFHDEFRCMPVIVAFRLEIVTGPAGMLLALITTFLKSFWTTWVRNGKPSMLTDGLTGNPLAV